MKTTPPPPATTTPPASQSAKSSAVQANARGMAALQAGDFAQAETHFAAAAAADPQAGALWRNLAHARRELGDDAGEGAALDAALAIDRTDFTAWIRKAQWHQRRAEHRDAIIAWHGVLQMAASIHPVPDALAQLLADARAYCDGQQAAMRGTLAAAMASDADHLAPMEQRRVAAFVDHAVAGRPVYQNQCAGLYYPFLPADEFFDDHHFPWFAELTAATPAICAELQGLMDNPDGALRPYVRQDAGTPDNIWSPLDNRLDWGAIFLWEYGAPNPAVLARCPATAAALGKLPSTHIPGRAPNAFFSILRPHTHIPPHTGVTNSRAIVHLPLIVPPGCAFRVGGETRQWVVGRPFAFDDTIEHEAWNNSDAVRAVLIFDVWNPHLTPAEQGMITRYFAATDAAVPAR
ncbi:MAG: aspartyl/asparaginyl beta-hydroxylase domain-containing protein [Sphingopyxis sp.]